MNTNLHHEKTLYLYSQALEHGDFEAVSAIFEQAADDPTLKTLLFELDATYQVEFPIELQKIERSVMVEPQPVHTDSANGYRPQMAARRASTASNGRDRRWLLRAAIVLIVLAGAVLVYRHQTPSDDVHVEVTPRFAQDPITAENVGQLHEIRRYGEGVARGALWTPDGDRIVVYGTLGIWIYDADDFEGEPILTINIDASIYDADMSPIGTLLATGHSDGTLRLYNIDTGEEEWSIEAHDGITTSVIFSPDGETIASAGGYEDPSISLWSVENGRKILDADESLVGLAGVCCLAFSANGERLAWHGASQVRISDTPGEYPFGIRPSITVMDLITRETRTFSVDDGWIRDLELSPDGNTVIAIHNEIESEIQVWDVEDIGDIMMPRLRTIAVADILAGSRISDVTWRADAVIDVLHSSQMAISELNIDTFDVVDTLRFNGIDSDLAAALNSPSRMSFSPDRNQVLITQNGGTIFLGDVTSQQPIEINQDYDARIGNFAINTSPSLLAIVESHVVTVRDIETDSTVAQSEPNAELSGTTDLAFMPDGETLAVARQDFESDDNLFLWNMTSNELRSLSIPQSRWRVWSVGINSDGSKVAYITDNEQVKLYDVQTGQTSSLTTNNSRMHFLGDERVRFKPSDDRVIVYTIGDTFIHVITDEGDEIANLSGNSNIIRDIAFSPDGRYLASVNDDGYLLMWETETWDEIAYVEVGRAFSVAFSIDGTMLAVGGERVISFWDTETHSLVGTLQGHTDWVTKLAFSEDDGLLVSLSYDGTVRLWAVE